MSDDPPARGPGEYHTTKWTGLRQIGTNTPEGRAALADFCKDYWTPIFFYYRRRLGDRTRAEDLTQSFFAMLLATDTLARADQSKGRFRNFLTKTAANFAVGEHRKSTAEKRGGRIEFDFDAASERYDRDAASSLDADYLIQWEWANALSARVKSRLAARYETDEQKARFTRLFPYVLVTPEPGDYAAAAKELDISHGTVKFFVHDLRGRYDELARLEAARGCERAEEGVAELEELARVVGAR